MSDPKVTDVNITSDGYGLTVEVTVQRSASPLAPGPRPEDVPKDILGALSVWIGGQQT